MTTATPYQPTLIGALWPAGRMAPALRAITLMIAGSVFLAACAQIAVPLQPVPITLQTFGVLVLGMAYGWRLGAATLALYLAEGAAGLPVFANFSSGPWELFGPASYTAGYLYGFVLAAGVVGWLAERGWGRTMPTTALAMLVGNILLYVPGLAWLAYLIGGEPAIAGGLMPFLLGDALKLALAACTMPLAWKLIGRFTA